MTFKVQSKIEMECHMIVYEQPTSVGGCLMLDLIPSIPKLIKR